MYKLLIYLLHIRQLISRAANYSASIIDSPLGEFIE